MEFASCRDSCSVVWPVKMDERFWSKVDIRTENECWPYREAVSDYGYGLFHPFSKGLNKGRVVRAHRYALEQKLGRPLLPKMQSCHTCDNPPCCNPVHLFEGTNAQNVADMVSKGRQARGEMKVNLAVLSDDKIIEIRHSAANGAKLKDLALNYQVSPSLITMVVKGQRWKHLGGPLTNKYRKGVPA